MKIYFAVYSSMDEAETIMEKFIRKTAAVISGASMRG
jgi:hypothetical protein